METVKEQASPFPLTSPNFLSYSGSFNIDLFTPQCSCRCKTGKMVEGKKKPRLIYSVLTDIKIKGGLLPLTMQFGPSILGCSSILDSSPPHQSGGSCAWQSTICLDVYLHVLSSLRARRKGDKPAGTSVRYDGIYDLP
jgi:hypothetical protein